MLSGLLGVILKNRSVLLGLVEWKALLDRVREKVKCGQLDAAASEVEILYTTHSVWRERVREMAYMYVTKWTSQFNRKMMWEWLFGFLITKEAFAAAVYVSEQLGYPVMRANLCGLLASSGAGLARKLILKRRQVHIPAYMEPCVLKAIDDTGWGREEVERWITLGVAVAVYLLSDPQRLRREVELLPEVIEQYVI